MNIVIGIVKGIAAVYLVIFALALLGLVSSAAAYLNDLNKKRRW